MKRLTETERALLLSALADHAITCEGAAKVCANQPRIVEQFTVQARQCEVLAAQIEQADGIGLEGIDG